MYRAVVLGLVSVLLASCWSSPRPKPPQRDLHIAISVEQIQLANGARLVVVPNPAASEVSVTVRYGVGAADDPVGREGLAHLVEHLLFEHVRDDTALFAILEDRALEYTGFTTLDETLYSSRALPSQLEELLELETLRIEQPCTSIPDAAFVRQREIVRNELREHDNDDVVWSVLHGGVYSPRHTFARRSTVESVAAITREQACDLVAKYYVPANEVVVVSGPVTLREAHQLADKTVGRIAKGTAPPPSAQPYDPRPHRIDLDGPVGEPWFVLAWPLPADPIERTKVQALASMAAGLVNARVDGTTTVVDLGAGRARTVAIAVAPSRDLSFDDALEGAKDEIARIGPWFGSGIYEFVKSRAIYRFATSLEDGLERDRELAEIAASGRDAGTVTDEALRGLLAMSRDEAEDIADRALDPKKATLIVLRPSKAGGTGVDTLAPVVREERRRTLEDPAEAHRRVENRPSPPEPFEQASTYTLKTGLRVVLLPLSAMPTLEIRLVLPVGTGDERTGQRGVALVAADALEPPFDTDMYKFVQAGGRVERDVYFDQTVFSTQGLATNLDLMIGGLAATIREGRYDEESVRDAVKWRARGGADARDRVAIAAWRDAIVGPDHAYHDAGLWNHADRAARDLDAVARFRTTHYVPDGATLVIAGHFDIKDAERWVDFYLQEWTGSPPERSERRGTLQPFAFAQPTTSSQIAVQIAFSAPSSDDVALAIVAEMLDEVIADVRDELAASYGVDARLVQNRLSSTIELSGRIDASRAGDAMALLRDRLADLRAGGDTAASRFVTARRHVVARLSSVDTSATGLADGVVLALARTGAPRLTLAAADHAMALTIDKVAPLLTGLELSHAAMMLRGPDRAIRDAYAAVGRKPTFLP